MEENTIIKSENDLPLVYQEFLLDNFLIKNFFINKLNFKYEDYLNVVVNIKESEILISIPINKTEYKTIIIPYVSKEEVMDNLYLQTIELKPFKEDMVEVEEEFFNN